MTVETLSAYHLGVLLLLADSPTVLNVAAYPIQISKALDVLQDAELLYSSVRDRMAFIHGTSSTLTLSAKGRAHVKQIATLPYPTIAYVDSSGAVL